MEDDQTKVSPWYKSTTVHQVWDPWRIDRGIVTILLHSQFHYSFPPLLYLPFLFNLFLSGYSYMLTHMLAHVLIHAQPCLLMCLLMRSSAYSYTVVVQYIRTGWTPLFAVLYSPPPSLPESVGVRQCDTFVTLL